MRPDVQTLLEWQHEYLNAPKAKIDPQITNDLENALNSNTRTSMDLLSHIDYIPEERHQGLCGNCWVWAGTGVAEIALDVQQGVFNRLSIQYFNSCFSDFFACCGGNQNLFANWYQDKSFVAWDNANASYADGCKWDGTEWECTECEDGISSIHCGLISQITNYPITNISAVTINTPDFITAIPNIKNILNQNRGVVWTFWLPDAAAWDDFEDFWDYEDETTIWYGLTDYCADPWNDAPDEGGGHSVLIVGYNDDDPNQAFHYWIALNSWGTEAGRPNGLFRIPMIFQYDCHYPIAGGIAHINAFQFETLDIDFADDIVDPNIGVHSPNGGESWHQGTVHNITWTASDNYGVDHVALHYSTDAGSSWTVIDSSEPNDGTYAWTVPNTPTTQARVRVTAYDTAGNDAYDISNSNFTITGDVEDPTITVISPNGGESWQPGTVHDILWTASDNVGVDHIALYLMYDGNHYFTIDSYEANDGTYAWMVPNIPTTQAKVKIYAYDADGNYAWDKNDDFFTITGSTGPRILLVDDDDNNPDVLSYYTDALDALGESYDIWNTNNSDNEPNIETLINYNTVIWFSGDSVGFAGPDDAGETYLDNWFDGVDSCFFISSQDYHYTRGMTAFMSNRLGVDSVTDDVSQTSVTGTGEPFTGLGPYTLDYAFYNYNFSDELFPNANGQIAFSGSTGNAALYSQFDDSGNLSKTAFLGFPFEAIPSAGNRKIVMDRFLNWCFPLRHKTFIPLVFRPAGFNSQFKGNADGWVQHSGSWSYNDNYLFTQGLDWSWSTVSYTEDFSNFDYEVKMMRSNGTEGPANTILVRGTPTPLASDNIWNSGYLFQYTIDGRYSIWKVFPDGSSTALQFWTSSSAINTGRAWNILRVIANGSNFYFYINGTLVWSGTDSTYSSGRVGIGMYLPHLGDEDFYVDWATLSTSIPSIETTDTVSLEQQKFNDEANKVPSTNMESSDIKP